MLFQTRPRAQNKRLTSNNNIRGEKLHSQLEKATRVHLKPSDEFPGGQSKEADEVGFTVLDWWFSRRAKHSLCVNNILFLFIYVSIHSFNKCLFTHYYLWAQCQAQEYNGRPKKKKREKGTCCPHGGIQWFFGTKLSVLNVQFSLEPILSQNSHTLLWFSSHPVLHQSHRRWWHPRCREPRGSVETRSLYQNVQENWHGRMGCGKRGGSPHSRGWESNDSASVCSLRPVP